MRGCSQCPVESIRLTLLERFEVVEARLRIESSRSPIGGVIRAAGAAIMRGFEGRREYGAAFGIKTGRPVHHAHELRVQVYFPIRAIKHVEIAITIGMEQKLALLALKLGINEHWRFLGVAIVGIVRRELEVPFERTRGRIQREDAVGKEIVARTG